MGRLHTPSQNCAACTTKAWVLSDSAHMAMEAGPSGCASGQMGETGERDTLVVGVHAPPGVRWRSYRLPAVEVVESVCASNRRWTRPSGPARMAMAPRTFLR